MDMSWRWLRLKETCGNIESLRSHGRACHVVPWVLLTFIIHYLISWCSKDLCWNVNEIQPIFVPHFALILYRSVALHCRMLLHEAWKCRLTSNDYLWRQRWKIATLAELRLKSWQNSWFRKEDGKWINGTTANHRLFWNRFGNWQAEISDANRDCENDSFLDYVTVNMLD